MSKVGVVFLTQHRVMGAVHLGRHEHPAQPVVQSRRQVDIGVGEQGEAAQHQFEREHHHRRDAGQQHRGDLDTHRQQDFQRMKAHARAGIEADVGVMHAVQSPQPFDPVHQPVLRAEQQVQRHEADTAVDQVGRRHWCSRPKSCACAHSAASIASHGSNSRRYNVLISPNPTFTGQRPPRRARPAGSQTAQVESGCHAWGRVFPRPTRREAQTPIFRDLPR